MVLAYPVARVFVGEYPATVALGNVIIALMVGLVPFSFVYMMQRAFFALEDTRTPFVFTTIQISLHIAGSLTLGATMPKQWLVVSLSLLTACTILVQGSIAYALLRKRIGGFGQTGVAKSLLGFVLAAIPAGFAGISVLELIGGTSAGSFAVEKVLNAILSSALVAPVIVITYVLLLWLFKVPELREVQKQLKARLTRR
jgi:putative peptidoglycan lipid II flippase